MTARWDVALREVTALPGVRGALVVSIDDGLVVADAAMDDVATADVAALAAALVSRATRCAQGVRVADPARVHLVATGGALVAVAGPSPLWLVALTRPGAELGRLRLVMNDFAGELR